MYVLENAIDDELLAVEVNKCVHCPPPASAKSNCHIPVVPDPDTEATLKNFSAVIFPVGNLIV